MSKAVFFNAISAYIDERISEGQSTEIALENAKTEFKTFGLGIWREVDNVYLNGGEFSE